MDEPTAIIVGNGFTKTYTKGRQAIFPSVVATEQAGIDFSGFKSGNDFVITFEDKNYAIGETAWKLGRIRSVKMDRSRIGSTFYKTLFAAALVKTAPESGPVNVILTLPVGWYPKREEIRKQMAGEYVVRYNKKTFVYTLGVRDLRIVPEGFGVLAGQLLDENGCIFNRDIAKSTIGIVEIGTGTTDLSLFKELELVPVKSKGLEIGLSDVWEGIQAEINQIYNRTLEVHLIDKAIREHGFQNGSEWIDITSLTKKHMPTLAEAVTGEIDNLWDSGREASAIYFAGGGTPQTYDYFKYSNQRRAENGHIADAIGAYLFGLFRMRQGK